MSRKTNTFIRAALLLAGFGLMAQEAFCLGTISGSVISDLPKNKSDVVVYLKGAVGPVHHKTEVLEQHHLTFIPKVMAIPVGSHVMFTNHDKTDSDVFSVSEANDFRLKSTKPGNQGKVTFSKTGAVNVLSRMHPEMSAWIVVTDNQYASVSSKTGEFTIPNVPAGTYQLAFWSEKLKSQGSASVTVENGKTARINVKIGD
jgi:plastocyanin